MRMFIKSISNPRGGKIVRNVVHPKNQSILTAIQATYPNAQKVLNIIPLKKIC